MKKIKHLYYDNLTFVRTKNDLEQWIKFFLVGIIQTAEKGINTLEKIIDLKQNIIENRILLMGKRSKQGQNLLNILFKYPVVSIKHVEAKTGLSRNAASGLVSLFVDNNILVEKTKKKKNRLFYFEQYIEMF